MTDLLGPANATNSTTARPNDTRVFDADDTWMKDCVGGVAGTGTKIEAAFFNGLLAQVRRAIRGMSIPVDNADDDMLLKAIQKAAQIEAYARGMPTNSAIYTAPGTFQLVVPAGVTRMLGHANGSGGSGGGAPANSFGGSGGGGGWYAWRILTVVPGETLDIIVPAGGVAGTGTQDGSPGAAAKIVRVSDATVLLNAPGGAAGKAGTITDGGAVQNNPGAGGPAVGTVVRAGQRGAQGRGPGNTYAAIGGMGGDSPNGGGGGHGTTSGGEAGTAPGGAGAGAGGFTGSNAVSGVGAAGEVALFWNDPPA